MWDGISPTRDATSSKITTSSEGLFWGLFPNSTIISMTCDDISRRVYVASQSQSGMFGILRADLLTGRVDKFFEPQAIQPLLMDMVEMILYEDHIVVVTQGTLMFWNIYTGRHESSMTCPIYKKIMTDRIICAKHLGGSNFCVAGIINGDKTYEVSVL